MSRLTRLVVIVMLLRVCATPAHAATLAEQVAAMQPGTWAPIAAANSAADVDPANAGRDSPAFGKAPPWRGNTGYGALFEAWNSGAFAPALGTCGAILYMGGGHTDYFGNEVVALDLCGLVWQRLSDPYQGPFAWPLADGAFPNGTPSVPHTYDRLVVDPDSNKLVLLDSAFNTLTAVDAGSAWLFDLATRRWSGPIQHRGSMEGVSAYDSKRKLVWFQPAVGRPGEVTSLDVATGTLTYYGAPTLGVLDAMMGYDPVRDRLVMTNFRNADTASIAELDPSRPLGGWAKVAQKGQPALKGQHAMAWSPTLAGWIVWDVYAGAGVWLMKANGSAYEWALLTDPRNTVTPTAGIGSFEKMQLVTVGGAELLIGLAKLSQGIYAFRLPGGTAAPVPGTTTEQACVPPADTAPMSLCTASTVTAETPGAALCDLPGVFVCDDFAAPRPGTLFTGSATPVVTGGELVLTLASKSSADAGGRYSVTFPPVGEGRTLALSYRVKADAGAMALEGRKEFTLWRGSSPCTDLELTQTHLYSSPLFILYTECGARGPRKYDAAHGDDYLLHYPDYHCRYTDTRAQNYANCAITHVDQWERFYIEIVIGKFGTPSSRLTAWHRTAGGKWKRYVDLDDWMFTGTGGFENFMLTAYMTGKDPTVEHAPGEVRYDDLVLATEPFGQALGITGGVVAGQP